MISLPAGMSGYSASGHGWMVADTVRTDAYARAIAAAVKPGDVVLDIGTGTGLFAILACRSGARRVYAVECDDIIEVARQNAAANGCAESIEFLHATSTEISLPERVDVIVSDLRGALPFYEHHLVALADARRRFLAPGGTLVSLADTLWVGCVEAENLHRDMISPWVGKKYGIDMSAARALVVNSWQRVHFNPGQMLTGALCCGTIDYARVESPDFTAKATLVASRRGIGHGLGVWFDATVAEGIGFSNSPDAAEPAIVYGQAFFPWPESVELEAGDTVTVSLKANLVADDYLWAWETWCRRKGESESMATHFRQSDFLGAPLSIDTLRRQSADRVVEVGDVAQVDLLILSSMNDGESLGEIARKVSLRFPAKYVRWQDALARVGEFAMRYGR